MSSEIHRGAAQITSQQSKFLSWCKKVPLVRHGVMGYLPRHASWQQRDLRGPAQGASTYFEALSKQFSWVEAGDGQNVSTRTKKTCACPQRAIP